MFGKLVDAKKYMLGVTMCELYNGRLKDLLDGMDGFKLASGGGG